MLSPMKEFLSLTWIPFPLTPSLFLGERGKHSSCVDGSEVAWTLATLRQLSPLPEGKGQGEGEDGASKPARIV